MCARYFASSSGVSDSRAGLWLSFGLSKCRLQNTLLTKYQCYPKSVLETTIDLPRKLTP
jgi:hypothetical protein